MTLDQQLSNLNSDSALALIEQSLVDEKHRVPQQMQKLARDPALSELDRSANIQVLSVFNIMEEFGYRCAKNEIFHSKMMNFLMNPRERHGLGGAFLWGLLRKASGNFLRGSHHCEDPEPSEDVSQVLIRREYTDEGRRVDLKAHDARHRFVLLIENKIRAPESPKQCESYWRAAARRHPNCAIAGLFLSPRGTKPKTAGRFPYVAISYGEVAELIEESIRERAANFSNMPAAAVEYAQALRRWFMVDPNLKALAWRLYSCYPQAFEYLQDPGVTPLGQLAEKLTDLITAATSLNSIPHNNAREIMDGELEKYFVPAEWERTPRLRSGNRLSERPYGNRLLIFWFGVYPTAKKDHHHDLALYLGLAPSPKNPKDHNALFNAIRRSVPSSAPNEFVHSEPRSGKWTHVWARVFATSNELRSPEPDPLFEDIERHWKEFLLKDLPKILKTASNLRQLK